METPTNEDEIDADPISLIESFNIVPIPPRVQLTCFGKIRAFNSFTKLEWVYMATALIALTVSLGITIQRLTITNANEHDFTFILLLLFTTGFCYVYVIHSMFTERWDELMVFVIAHVIVLLYSIVNYATMERTSQKLARLIFLCVCSPFLIGGGVLQSVKYFRSNNLIFDTVGASSSLQNSCQLYYICSSLLKFDLQLQLSMYILVIRKVDSVYFGELEQKIILASGVLVSSLFIVVGFLGLRHENKPLMVLFYILSLFEPVYIGYKFYYVVSYETTIDAVYNSTFVCGSFALVIWLLLITSTVYFVFYHFGKGLKERMFEDHGWTQSRSFAETTYLLSPDMIGIQS